LNIDQSVDRSDFPVLAFKFDRQTPPSYAYKISLKGTRNNLPNGQEAVFRLSEFVRRKRTSLLPRQEAALLVMPPDHHLAKTSAFDNATKDG
jgi:hypothetical protein